MATTRKKSSNGASKNALLAGYLDPKSENVKVGAQTLKLERLVIHRHRQFFTALSELSMDSLGTTLKGAFADSEGDWLSKLPEVFGVLMGTIGTLGGDALGQAVAAALDTEANFKTLKANSCIPEDAKPERAPGLDLHVGSEALRQWVLYSCEIPQAVSILHATIQLNAMDELGKAGWALMMKGWNAAKSLPKAVQNLVPVGPSSSPEEKLGSDNSESPSDYTAIAG